MPSSPHEVALAEKGLRELEVLLQKPESNVKTQTSTGTTAACLNLSRPNGKCEKLQKPLHRTAYLDGLRGFAALLVFSLHHQGWGHSSMREQSILENAFGFDERYYFVSFPGLRLLFSGGHLAVAVFFVISGYVLSAKPMSLVHAGEFTKMADNLASSMFRRWLRLYIPVICTTFLWMTSWHLFNIRSGTPRSPLPEPTYFAEVWKWYCDFKNYSYVFQNEPKNAYNDHTWSIPMEFRGSIVIYTSILAFSRCRRNARLWCEVGLIFYFHSIVDAWFCGLFVMGMLICDLDLLASRHDLPHMLNRLRPLPKWTFYVVFIIGVWLGGVPSITDNLGQLRRSPGWYYLSFLKPQAFWDFRWFFRFWAATFIMISVPRVTWLKSFFETRFCQYLGRVSFAFYLIHGPVLWTFGDRLYAATGRIREEHIGVVPTWINVAQLPAYGPFGLEVNFLIPQFISLAFNLWLAELATRLFDGPSVRISQWLYKKLVLTNEPSEKSF